MDDNMRILRLGSIDIPYEIIVNKRLKYMRVSLDTSGMKVSLPRKISIKEIESFLRSKEKWIYEHYIKLKSIKDEQAERTWERGESLLYRGDRYCLTVHDWDKKSVRAAFNGEQFDLYVNRSLTGQDRKDAADSAFKKLYISMAREQISEKLGYYSDIIGVSYKDVRIKEQNTRWGSCSKKGNLNFNWRIIMAPDWVMDYVIVHELCHLRFMNHSKDFWGMVETYIPNLKMARQWLKDNGMRLVI